MSNPRVFIAERPRENIDLTKAAVFGDLVILTDHSERRLAAFEATEYALRVSDTLQKLDFDPAIDYFCVVGPVLPVSITVAVLASRHGLLSILCYNIALQRYVQRTLDTRKVMRERERNRDGEIVTRLAPDAPRSL